MIDLEMVNVAPPCIHLVAPGQVHQLDRSANCEGSVVMFRQDLHHAIFGEPALRSLLRAGVVRNIRLSPEQSIEALDLVRSIEKEVDDTTQGNGPVAEYYLAILLLKSVQWSQAGLGTDHNTASADLVSRFIEKVDQEFLDKKQVNAYAKDLAISPGHLNELVKKRLGRSASDVVHERTLLEAKRLLLHSSSSVKEVSFALRMEDPAYFTRMFRKATGMTPGEYREHIREKYQH